MIDRPKGSGDYLFLHFLSSVDIQQQHQLVTTEPNACILYTPDCPQWFHSPNHELQHHWFHFTCDEMPRLLTQWEFPYNQIFYPFAPTFIALFINELLTEHMRKDLHWQDAIDGLTLQFFAKLARDLKTARHTKANPAQAATLEKFKQIRAEMLRQVELPWTIRDLANMAGLSDSRFSVRYKELFETSAKEDLIRARLEKAKHLLTNTALTVKSVAELVGYTNEFHFIRQFKERTGCTPGQYAMRWLEADAVQSQTPLPD